MPLSDKEQQREYQKAWIAKRRSDFFMDKACVKCGSTLQLELDHIDETTKVEHRIWSWAEERRLAELSKCQVLCKVCHHEKTMAAMPKTHGELYKHGTETMYRNHGCRCKECRAYNAAKTRAYRANRANKQGADGLS